MDQMSDQNDRRIPVTELDIPLDRDVFLRTLIRELSGVLEDVVGLEEASGFISIVGQNIGNQMDLDYKEALGVSRLTRAQVADVLVDLKVTAGDPVPSMVEDKLECRYRFQRALKESHSREE